MMEFIPEETTGKSTDTSPQQKFEKTENCILECVQNTVDAHIDKGTPILKFHFQLIKKSECDFLNNKTTNLKLRIMELCIYELRM